MGRERKQKGSLQRCTAFCLIAWLVAVAGSGRAAECVSGLREVSDNAAPILADDGSREMLHAAVGQSLAALRSLPASADSRWRDGPFSRERRLCTLRYAERLLNGAPGGTGLEDALDQEFVLYEACDANAQPESDPESDNDTAAVLVTGYFEPELAGSLTPTPAYSSPLYRLPADLEEGRIGDNGRRRVWQRRGFLYQYPPRGKIEGNNLLAGRELVWLADPLESFVLHVQGSGRIRLPDGTVQRVRYAGNNGQDYTSIGKVLVTEGKLRREEADLPGILHYLREHPGEQQRVLAQNKRYIFFDWNAGESAGPPGSMGAPLTPGRSVALDNAVYPPGALGFLETTRPRFDVQGRVFSWVSLHRLVVAQDTGAAIKGPGRVDYFYGNGPYARRAAGVMRQSGRFFLLVKKDTASPVL